MAAFFAKKNTKKKKFTLKPSAAALAQAATVAATEVAPRVDVKEKKKEVDTGWVEIEQEKVIINTGGKVIADLGCVLFDRPCPPDRSSNPRALPTSEVKQVEDFDQAAIEAEEALKQFQWARSQSKKASKPKPVEPEPEKAPVALGWRDRMDVKQSQKLRVNSAMDFPSLNGAPISGTIEQSLPGQQGAAVKVKNMWSNFQDEDASDSDEVHSAARPVSLLPAAGHACQRHR
jgi:hypothetical protein